MQSIPARRIRAWSSRNADDVGAAPEFAVEALKRIRIPYERARCRL
jgi:hypothetical protein